MRDVDMHPPLDLHQQLVLIHGCWTRDFGQCDEREGQIFMQLDPLLYLWRPLF